MSQSMKLHVISPESVFLSTLVSMAVVPGVCGDFAVMPGHSLVCARLKPGVVTLSSSSGDEQTIFVAGGFAHVRPDVCSLLVESPVLVSELRLESIEAAMNTIDAASTPDAFDILQAQKEAVLAFHSPSTSVRAG